jgi:hypothetical protein
MTKTPDQLQYEHVVRTTLEAAAERLLRERCCSPYMAALARGAKMIRAMKP